MNAFVVAGVAMLVCIVPCLIVCCRAKVIEAVVAYEVISSVVVMVLVLLAQGFGRSGEFELPIVLAVLLLGSGLVFVRSLERWF